MPEQPSTYKKALNYIQKPNYTIRKSPLNYIHHARALYDIYSTYLAGEVRQGAIRALHVSNGTGVGTSPAEKVGAIVVKDKDGLS